MEVSWLAGRLTFPLLVGFWRGDHMKAWGRLRGWWWWAASWEGPDSLSGFNSSSPSFFFFLSALHSLQPEQFIAIADTSGQLSFIAPTADYSAVRNVTWYSLNLIIYLLKMKKEKHNNKKNKKNSDLFQIKTCSHILLNFFLNSWHRLTPVKPMHTSCSWPLLKPFQISCLPALHVADKRGKYQ